MERLTERLENGVIAASGESRAREKILGALNDGEPGVKLEFDGDTVTAAYVYESNTTRTSGCVWKYDYIGPQFSSTGFDGPYKRVEDMLP